MGWPVLSELVTRTKDVCDSLLRTKQEGVELSWALPKAAWMDTSSNRLEGNARFLGADEGVSSEHPKRDASASVKGNCRTEVPRCGKLCRERISLATFHTQRL